MLTSLAEGLPCCSGLRERIGEGVCSPAAGDEIDEVVHPQRRSVLVQRLPICVLGKRSQQQSLILPRGGGERDSVGVIRPPSLSMPSQAADSCA
jgi:hypothetical protein